MDVDRNVQSVTKGRKLGRTDDQSTSAAVVHAKSDDSSSNSVSSTSRAVKNRKPRRPVKTVSGAPRGTLRSGGLEAMDVDRNVQSVTKGRKLGGTDDQSTSAESEVPSSKRLSSTHESDSDETEKIEVGPEEIEVISQQDIKDAEVAEKSEDEVEVNSEEQVKIIGCGFTEMENSYTVIHREIVKEKGVTWYLEESSARLTFHPGAVTQPSLITCSLWSPSVLSPPLHCNEALVSNVIEVCLDNPPELKSIRDAKRGVTVALLHSARELEGYEVVIKQLVDPDIKEWIDLKTQGNWHVSGSLDRLMNFAEASCPLTRRSSFAVIWRLKSFQFSRQNSVAADLTCILPDYPDVSVTIPSNSVQVNEDFCLTVKVHEFPSIKVQKERFFLGPALHISCSPNVTLLGAATIKIPLSLREDKRLLDTELSSGHLRILHYSTTKEESPTWTEITQTLETKATIIDGIVTFKVKHFSGFCEKTRYHNSLPVNQVQSTDLNVKLFPQWKEEETTELCTLYLIPRSPFHVLPHATFENWPHGELFTSKREEMVDVRCATSALCESQRKRSLAGLTVKEGRPTRKELGRLAAQIEKWKPLGRQLDFDDASLTGFDRDHSEYREKVYAMLSEWKQRGGAKNATYQILYDALCDELVAYRDLAERFCCQEK